MAAVSYHMNADDASIIGKTMQEKYYGWYYLDLSALYISVYQQRTRVYPHTNMAGEASQYRKQHLYITCTLS